uniref:Uncharacterized protein n=1 Tax=viral metagenome TaxID=1070528 RepID=A0A6M3L5R8_9ZZZZ
MKIIDKLNKLGNTKWAKLIDRAIIIAINVLVVSIALIYIFLWNKDATVALGYVPLILSLIIVYMWVNFIILHVEINKIKGDKESK